MEEFKNPQLQLITDNQSIPGGRWFIEKLSYTFALWHLLPTPTLPEYYRPVSLCSPSMVSEPRSTTDFPAPQTTDVNSDISNAYQLYLQHCGPPMQDAQQGAIAEYKLDQNKDPDDPSGQDFSAWAYTHILSYRNSYQLCVNGENKYKDLLATFVPDKPTSTSGPGEQAAESGQPSSSGSGPSTNSDDTGKGQGTKGSNGRVNSDVPKFIGIISSLLTAQMLLV
ncbi:hypothetical protein C8J57DRAFT_1215262 [Mycena rebaudengoi]|nr:hypothetical protein C8J57DRAFT_1215262 [Mycena rebaudengoi]